MVPCATLPDTPLCPAQAQSDLASLRGLLQSEAVRGWGPPGVVTIAKSTSDPYTPPERAQWLLGEVLAMLEADYEQIPDLHFNIELLAVDSPHVACRLRFDVTPKGSFLGLAVDGKNVTFCENAFYLFSDGKIREVWSVIDKAAIEAQLG